MNEIIFGLQLKAILFGLGVGLLLSTFLRFKKLVAFVLGCVLMGLPFKDQIPDFSQVQSVFKKQSSADSQPLRSKQPSLPNLTLDSGYYAVNVDKLNVRLSPNTTKPPVFDLVRGDIVKVTSNIAGWAQISPEFSGVRFGDSGLLTLWARGNFLDPVSKVPNSPTKPEIFSAIAQSEDITVNYEEMLIRTSELVQSQECTLTEISKNLGWSKAREQGYFTLCGDSTIYLD